MYLGVGFVYVLILVLVSPLIWLAWWMLADLGQRASGSARPAHDATSVESRRQVA